MNTCAIYAILGKVEVEGVLLKLLAHKSAWVENNSFELLCKNRLYWK